MAVFMREGQGASEPRQGAKLWALTLVLSLINSVNQCGPRSSVSSSVEGEGATK